MYIYANLYECKLFLKVKHTKLIFLTNVQCRYFSLLCNHQFLPCVCKHACISLTKYSSDLQFQFRNVFQKQQTINVMNKTPYTEYLDKRSCNLGGHGVTYISVTSPSWYFSEKVSSNLKYLVQSIQTLMIQYYSHDAEFTLQLMFSKLLSKEIIKMVQSILYYQLLLCSYLTKEIF